MKTKILCLHYRVPEKFGGQCASGQAIFFEDLHSKYNLKVLCFGPKRIETDALTAITLCSTFLKKLFNLLFLKSSRLTHYSSRSFKRIYKNILEVFKPDYIYVEHLLMMQYPLMNKGNAKVIFFDDESCLYASKFNLRTSLVERVRNVRLCSFERSALSSSDFVITISKEEKEFLSSLGYKHIEAIPYGINTEYYSYNWKAANDPFKMLFIGDYSHYPNREAVRILINKILPNLSHIENRKLVIVGRNTSLLKIVPDNRIEVFDNVQDVRPFYWSCSCLVAPIFSGSGIRIKIMEAASCGIPLIISPVANYTFHFLDEIHAKIAHDISSFTKKINELYSNDTVEKILYRSKMARERIAEFYSEENIKIKFQTELEKIIYSN